jgi:hypothetical protein
LIYLFASLIGGLVKICDSGRGFLIFSMKPTSALYIHIKIGKIVFAGTPSDFSGELIPEIEYVAEPNGINVIPTSFNGGYVGYITKDKWYDLHEIRNIYYELVGPL